jgi:succinate-acetate transporter protein
MDRDGSTPQTIVVLRPLGSPLALGLSGLAIASFLTAGFDLRWIAAGQAHLVGLLVLVTVVPMQAVSALLAFGARDGATGGSFGLQAATWAALGVSYAASAPATTSGATGLVLLAGGALLALSGASAARAKLLAGSAIGLSGVRFVLVAISQLGAGTGWQKAGAIVGLAVAAIAAYTAWASEVEDMADGTVLPTGRLGAGRASLQAPYAEQVRGVHHEPGVRRQL